MFIAETDMDSFKPEEYTGHIENAIKETGVETVLIGSNKNGKELASRLAAKLDSGCIIDVTDLYVKDKKLNAERVVYSGNAISVEQFNSKPEIVTIPSKVYSPSPKDDNRTGEILKKRFDIENYASKIVKIQDMQSDSYRELRRYFME